MYRNVYPLYFFYYPLCWTVCTPCNILYCTYIPSVLCCTVLITQIYYNVLQLYCTVMLTLSTVLFTYMYYKPPLLYCFPPLYSIVYLPEKCCPVTPHVLLRSRSQCWHTPIHTLNLNLQYFFSFCTGWTKIYWMSQNNYFFTQCVSEKNLIFPPRCSTTSSFWERCP